MKKKLIAFCMIIAIITCACGQEQAVQPDEISKSDEAGISLISEEDEDLQIVAADDSEEITEDETVEDEEIQEEPAPLYTVGTLTKADFDFGIAQNTTGGCDNAIDACLNGTKDFNFFLSLNSEISSESVETVKEWKSYRGIGFGNTRDELYAAYGIPVLYEILGDKIPEAWKKNFRGENHEPTYCTGYVVKLSNDYAVQMEWMLDEDDIIIGLIIESIYPQYVHKVKAFDNFIEE